MDVDLLRPGTVPISKDTVMWFEFLLDPTILKQHLLKAKPDPSPIDLIIKFLTISSDITNGVKDLDQPEILVMDLDAEGDSGKFDEAKQKSNQMNRRSLGLKILALKIAAFLNWDLDILETKLPVSIQLMLITDLLKLTRESLADPSVHYSLSFIDEPDEVLFAVSLYHRWAIRTIVNNSLPLKSRYWQGVLEPNMGPPALLGDGEVLNRLEEDADKSANIIMNSIAKLCEERLLDYIMIPSYDSFVSIAEEGDIETPNWQLGVKARNSEFLCMVLLDWSSYLFFREDYHSVKTNIEKCKKQFEKWTNGQTNSTGQFCKTTYDTITGYLLACETPMLTNNLSLTDKFHVSVREHYVGILSILMEDNIKREIPICHRESLELDIAAALSSGTFTATRDLLFQIQTLNTVLKRAVDCVCFYDYSEKLNNSRRSVEILVWALKPLVALGSPEERERIRSFLIEVMETCDTCIAHDIANTDVVKLLVTQQEIAETLSFATETVPVPIAVMHKFYLPDFNNIKLKSADLEKQLLSTDDPQKIREVIMKLVELNSIRPVHQINCKWELGIHLHTIISNMPNGILQHLLYVLLGKAKHLDNIGKYDCARRLLAAAEQDALHHGGPLLKLAHLISWEALLVDIHQLHDDWPIKPTGWQTLIPRCTNALQMTDSMVCPRIEILEQAAVTLLNLGEWETLVALPTDKRWVICDLATNIAFACQDIVKFKGVKKVARDAWDLIVPVFGPSSLQKRNLPSIHQDSNPISHAIVTRFLSYLRDHTAFSCAISLLARLHNVLRDEASLELVAEYTTLWPGVVSNANSYNISLVCETLLQLINQALEYFPKNVAWFKLLGDHHFVNNYHSGAMKYYLLAAIIASDNFHRPLTKLMVEDYVYKRMIKSLAQMQCHTQAGILCQFLEEIDYNTAFKCLSELVCHDSMDTYYDCIWDVNILEFLICLHTKKGNRDRAKKAIDTIGLLELNSNNNEEIKREAANKRKTRFMQALARQYVF